MNTDIEDFFQDGLETLAFDQTSSHIPPGAPDLNGRSWFGDLCDAPLRDSTNNTEKVSISRSGAERRLQVRAAVLLILFFSPLPARAADVKPETAQAWQEYIKAAEARPTDAAELRGEILVSPRSTAQDETLDATNTHAEARDSDFRQRRERGARKPAPAVFTAVEFRPRPTACVPSSSLPTRSRITVNGHANAIYASHGWRNAKGRPPEQGKAFAPKSVGAPRP